MDNEKITFMETVVRPFCTPYEYIFEGIDSENTVDVSYEELSKDTGEGAS